MRLKTRDVLPYGKVTPERVTVRVVLASHSETVHLGEAPGVFDPVPRGRPTSGRR